MQAYNINLAIYRHSDTPPYDTSTDLTIIPQLGKPVILNRCKDEATDSADPSGQPPLISGQGDTGNVVSSSSNSTKTTVKPEWPTRVQPYRKNKEYVVYYAMDSDSSSNEPTTDKTHPDEKYVPLNLKGIKILAMFPLNI